MIDWPDYLAQRGLNEHTVIGDLKVLPNLWSPQRRNRRDIFIYLPPSYHRRQRRYPVIYMHDGQNLFDQATSFAGEWQVDEIMQDLSQEGLEAIIVGVANAGSKRLDEYSPFRNSRRQGGQGERYLEFVVKTLKPLIDRSFHTRPERAYTGMIGSSMGGLISLYAFFHYPDVFGLVGAMSPSLWFAEQAIFHYVEKASFITGKIYLDVGTHEQAYSSTGEVLSSVHSRYYATSVLDMYNLLRRKGYSPHQDLLYVEEEGAIHHESAWSRRLPAALRFLLQS